MGKCKLTVVVVIVAGAAFVFCWQHLVSEGLRRENNTLKAAIAELKELPKTPQSSIARHLFRRNNWTSC